MLCFLCSFAKGGYCYCCKGRPITVVSTLDMLFVDTAFPMATAMRRRAQSVPARRGEWTHFVRFRSLREAKLERRDRRQPLRVDVVSIPSSAESKLRRRKKVRERAKRRREAQLSSTSSSVSMNSIGLEDTQLLAVAQQSSKSDSDNERTSSADLAVATVSPSRSSFAVLVNDKDYDAEDANSEDSLPSLPEQSVLANKSKVCPTIIDRLHLDLVQLPETLPNGCFASVSYTADMEHFAQKRSLNAFVDPFEEEERRSRTEMWVDSTSPFYATEDEERQASGGESDKANGIPQVKVSGCSEKSVSPSPPENTATSTTGADDEICEPTVQIQINDELASRSQEKKGCMDRMDSLVASEISEGTSLVSSDLDKTSLIKMNFTCNLHRAREDAEREVNLENFDRFWRYYYNKAEACKEDSEKERSARELNRRRCRTPTIERVVLYYTTDRRISLAPTVSSLSPSPASNSQRSCQADSGHHLFIQPQNPSPVREQEPSTTESSRDEVTPLVTASPPVVETAESALQLPAEAKIVIYESVEGHQGREQEKEAEQDLENQTGALMDQIEQAANLGDQEEDELFFQLDEMSDSDSEEGRVVVNTAMKCETKRLPSSPFETGNRLTDQSTSTADLFTDVIESAEGWSKAESIYKKEVRDVSTLTTPPLMAEVQPQRKQMLDQATSTINARTPPPPMVILEDAPETDVSLPDFKDQLSDIDTSSLEDLLAMDTRPESSNRKSVTFSDFIDVEILSPDPRKSVSPDFHNFTIKPILKKEDKQAESMRRLMGYAAERLYKDLLMLVEERDRAIHALELTPEDGDEILSPQTCIFQKRYRDKLLENKIALDKKIDQVWMKLKDMGVDGAKEKFIFGVRHSSELTLNIKRRVGLRRESAPEKTLKHRSGFEMASDMSRRSSQVRQQLKRRDSDTSLSDESRSMNRLLSNVSRILANSEKLGV